MSENTSTDIKLNTRKFPWFIGLLLPLLPYIIVGIIAVVFLLPLMFFAGDSVNPPGEYDFYYGAESSSGGIPFKLSGQGLMGWVVDAPVRISSGFGMRLHPIEKIRKMHTGIDITAGQGVNILAALDGKVISAGSMGGYGQLVAIQHPNGLVTRYAHMSKILVDYGDIVTKGQVIGQVGSTGNSTGPHLHFEVLLDGTFSDPAPYLGLVPDIPEVLPDELKYAEVNSDKLNSWLKGRNSLLAEEPYFSTILKNCKDYNVNPLLMFAITGQEQSFVPKSEPSALRIANNPFNVYYSWQNYNTDINDSSKIACVTVINLSKNRPETVNPLYWINTRGGAGGYAGDKNWWVGVSRIFAELKRDINPQ